MDRKQKFLKKNNAPFKDILTQNEKSHFFQKNIFGFFLIFFQKKMSFLKVKIVKRGGYKKYKKNKKIFYKKKRIFNDIIQIFLFIISFLYLLVNKNPFINLNVINSSQNI